MPPNVRSVIAQVHQKSRAMGSRRNFCSHPVAETNGGRVKVVAAGVLKKIGFGTSIVLGFFIGSALEFIALEPMLLKSMEEEKLRLIRHEELVAKAYHDFMVGPDKE
ncbi:uncharacterized protein LOC110229800 [Arabidopsis lyrata subsp. lyrata]|uniref:uncharacterized protein LOC110229800 n=1 Tax=Arabidopsis lyrata subsp. lyrata TaxID=81972 RepID=UPI000A29ABCE|nr:uncharacterized protein LOC110229800 [Arabidopsis lyrata subsp. lyrata]|eukprot:XP_020886374.1 uncharacterized protein LOC110229800 [Arabidopsis lyrata subsp. lyrata]